MTTSTWQCQQCWYSENNTKAQECEVCDTPKQPSKRKNGLITGHKRRRSHNTSNPHNNNNNNANNTNPKPSKRAKMPQLIDDEDEDDDLQSHHSPHPIIPNNDNNRNKNKPKNGIIHHHNIQQIDSNNNNVNNYGFQFNFDAKPTIKPSPFPTDPNQQYKFAKSPFKSFISPSIPTSSKTKPKQHQHRSDKEEMDEDDNINHNIKRIQTPQIKPMTPQRSKKRVIYHGDVRNIHHSRSSHFGYDDNANLRKYQHLLSHDVKYNKWGNKIRRFSDRYDMEQDIINDKIQNYRQQLNEYKRIERALGDRYDLETFDLLQSMSERRAALLNEIDGLNDVNDGQRWYPMMNFNEITKRYRPDVYKYKPKEYSVYVKRLNEQILRQKVDEQMMEDQIYKNLFKRTNDKMWRYLLKQCDEIKQNVKKVGIFYYKGNYNGNEDMWHFRNNEEKEEYGNSLIDLLNWYNLHENKQYNDNKIGVIMLQKSEDERSCGYVPVFKRVDIWEYDEYRRKFKVEMDEFDKSTQRDNNNNNNKEPQSVIYKRVIKMNLNGKKRNNKKRRSLGDHYNNAPFTKRRRLSDPSTVRIPRHITATTQSPIPRDISPIYPIPTTSPKPAAVAPTGPAISTPASRDRLPMIADPVITSTDAAAIPRVPTSAATAGRVAARDTSSMNVASEPVAIRRSEVSIDTASESVGRRKQRVSPRGISNISRDGPVSVGLILDNFIEHNPTKRSVDELVGFLKRCGYWTVLGRTLCEQRLAYFNKKNR